MRAALGVIVLAAAGLYGALVRRRERYVDLSGRVAIVTGGGRGLGLAIARELQQRGCTLAICGRDAEVIARAVAELGQRGPVLGAVCDASERAQVEAFVGVVVERFGAVDVLVNNAGQCFVGPAVELQAEDVAAALRNIFWTQFHPTTAVLPQMRARRFGRIVNISSIGGKVPLPHHAAYAAGKFAVTGWSETLAAELVKEGIFVSTITPPPLDDGASLTVHFGGAREREFRWFSRLLTSPLSAADTEHVARVVADAAQYGDRERSASLGAWLAVRLHGAAPNVMSRALALVDRVLPSPGAPGRATPMTLGREVVGASRDPEVQRLAAASRRDASRFRPHPERRAG